MLWFFRNNIGMGRTNYKRVEMKALVDSALECSNHNYGESINQQSKKHEAYPYKTIGWRIIPQRERECSVEECSKLIEAAQMLAADLGIIVRYGD